MTMRKQVVHTPKVPSARVPLSQAIKAGDWVFASGQLGLVAPGKLAEGGIAAETRQVCENLKAVLVSRAGQMNDIVKMTIYVLSKSEYKTRARDIGAVYRDYFGRHYPAMTLVEVKGLYDDECLIEIEAIAVVG